MASVRSVRVGRNEAAPCHGTPRRPHATRAARMPRAAAWTVVVWVAVLAAGALQPTAPLGATPLQPVDRAVSTFGSAEPGQVPGEVDPGSAGSAEGDAEGNGEDPGTGRGPSDGGTGGGATGPSPTGQPRPDTSQRTLDTVIWVGLLAALGVAAVVVVRVWRDVGVDPPLVDVDTQPRGEHPDADR